MSRSMRIPRLVPLILAAGLTVPTAGGTVRPQVAASWQVASGQAPAGEAPVAGSLSPTVARLADQADRLRQARRLEEALSAAEAALVEAQRTGDRFGAAFSQSLRASILESLENTDDARSASEQALAAFEALGNTLGMARSHSGIARSAAVLGDRPAAWLHGNEAVRLYRELGDDRAVAMALQNLMGVADSPAAERAMLDELMAIAGRLEDPGLRGGAFKALGARQFADGDLAAAKASYDAAIAAFRQADDPGSLGTSYLSLGRVYRAHGDHQGALERYQRASELLESIGSRLDLIEAINASAVALGHLNRQQESIAAYERGLALARESGNQRYIDFMLGNLAGGYMGSKAWSQALPLLEEVLGRRPEPYIAAFRHTSMAVVLAELDRETEALAHANDAIRITRELRSTESLHSRLDTRAWVLDRLGRLEDALADEREALDVVEQIRASLVPNDFLKRGYGDVVVKYYGRSVDLLSRLGHAEDALDMAEQGRARAFLDLLSAREDTGNDASLPTRGGQVLGPETGSLPSLAFAASLPTAGITEIAARLQSTIVAYWVNDEATTIWVIRPDGRLSATRVAVTGARIEQLVSETTAALRDVPESRDASADVGFAALPMRGLSLLRLTRDPRTAWRELYALLVEPIRTELPTGGGRLTIVPHGPLFHLSFAALQNADGRYLIEDHELHYSPAASVLAYTGRRREAVLARTPGPWLLVGDPAARPLVGDTPLPPLPGADRELTAIAGAAASRRVVRLSGAAADEASLARAIDAERPSVVHFATHGLVPDDPASPPFLALQRRGPRSHEDGRLTSDEVYGLRLQTSLVVLSACRSGSGRVSADGMIGLTRAFFAAGTPSVVATLWDVTDETTAALMIRFYRDYAAGRAKGASLRSAQLELLKDLRAGRIAVTVSGRKTTLPEHPLLWAAFFLSGEP